MPVGSCCVDGDVSSVRSIFREWNRMPCELARDLLPQAFDPRSKAAAQNCP